MIKEEVLDMKIVFVAGSTGGDGQRRGGFRGEHGGAHKAAGEYARLF